LKRATRGAALVIVGTIASAHAHTIDFRENSPTISDFSFGWSTAYSRTGLGITSASSQAGTFTGCSVNGAAASATVAEYDCAIFSTTAHTGAGAGTGTNVVAERDQAYIASGIVGAAWAGLDAVDIPDATTNGFLAGREIDLFNGGPFESNPMAQDNKVGLWLSAGGHGGTEALGIAPITSSWLYGLWASSATFSGLNGSAFLWLDNGAGAPLFDVDSAGQVSSIGYQTRTGTTGSFTGHHFNIDWVNGAAQLYIDGANVGTITLTSPSAN
jgi:hypothetical protein